MTYLHGVRADTIDWAKQHGKKEREGQTLVTLKKNVEQGVFLLIDSFVVSVSYKTRKGVL